MKTLLFKAEVAKLADALDLGSSVERRASSSLALGTIFFVEMAGCRLSKRHLTPAFSMGVTDNLPTNALSFFCK